jgi:methylglutaconyl-CoA hydratase
VSAELVHLEVARGVGTVTLDSPSNRHALSSALLGELDRQLAQALGDDGVRVIVLTATGSVFCSGADLKERRAAEPAAAPGPRGGLAAILARMWDAPKPIVGRINGPARAGGVGLVAACDIAVAVETATFAMTEVRIGVIPAIVSVVLIPKVGQGRALELFLTGDAFDARAAVSYGLVNAAAPAGTLDAVVGRYLDSLLAGAPGALAGCKRLVRDVPTFSMDAAFAEMAERSRSFFASPEAREGLAAFVEKRPPRWRAPS